MNDPLLYSSFHVAAEILRNKLMSAPAVRTERWQGIAANQGTRELLNVDFRVDLHGSCQLEDWRRDIQPSLPWADDHFMERIGGEPLNPGVQWQRWPWAGSAARFKVDRFNHTYMERLWPKFARRSETGQLSRGPEHLRSYPVADRRPRQGIGHSYGDLEDLIDLLAAEPHTRQAWIPLFFPEDTGPGDGGRKPCTLGYQIIVREGHAHIWYPLRSCDFIRHFRDDCYLAVRLLIFVINECRERNPAAWADVVPGTYSMHMTSLHVFEGDRL